MTKPDGMVFATKIIRAFPIAREHLIADLNMVMLWRIRPSPNWREFGVEC